MKRVTVFALALNVTLLGGLAHQLVAVAGGNPAAVQNGDTNGDGSRDIGDAIYLLQWLFSGGSEPVSATCGEDLAERVAELEGQLAAAQAALAAACPEPGEAPVSFSAQIAPVLKRCSTCHSSLVPIVPRMEECTGCHPNEPPAAGLDLHGNPQFIYENLVEVPSTELPGMHRITRGAPSESYLWRKINGTHLEIGGSGEMMPLGAPALDEETLNIIERWILDGAPLN